MTYVFDFYVAEIVGNVYFICTYNKVFLFTDRKAIYTVDIIGQVPIDKMTYPVSFNSSLHNDV